jgi:hypothetical protein
MLSVFILSVPILMFASKAIDCQSGAPTESPLSITANIRLAVKASATNNLAYLATASVTKKKVYNIDVMGQPMLYNKYSGKLNYHINIYNIEFTLE